MSGTAIDGLATALPGQSLAAGASVTDDQRARMPVLVWLLLCLIAPPLAAQPLPATVVVEVRATGAPVAGAAVIIEGVTYATSAQGVATAAVPAGPVELTVVRAGGAPRTVSLDAAAGATQRVVVDLDEAPMVEEEVVVIASTRTVRGLDDQPLRVDILPREEIEEKLLMTPGDIVMMLNEMGGMRVQATSASLGAASVRIQGMRGRYTRVLADGLPLFGDVNGLGLLQIPPTDLGQVEVIKGVASSMYGAGAMGGVINLIARRPGRTVERELLLNRSTRGGTDGVGYLSTPLSDRWGMTVLAGGHFQERIDVNRDGWSDLPYYGRGVIRPRVFWDNGRGRTFFATAGTTIEDREGGTVSGARVAGGDTFAEALHTRRGDGGFVAQSPFGDRLLLTARGAVTEQRHTHRFGDLRERDRHRTGYAEVAVRGASGRHAWAGGTAVEYQAYDPRVRPDLAHRFTIPGLFAQDDVEVTRWLSVSASARVDVHSRYGTFASPRVAALARGGGWSSRASVGTGFYGSTVLTEETEAAGLSRLAVPRALRAERGRSASLDVTRDFGAVAVTATLFASRVSRPLDVSREGLYTLTNAPEPTRHTGIELLGTLRHEPFAVTATYTHVRASEQEGAARVAVPLTPRHSAGMVAMWEREDVGRAGLELYYTGPQRLEANPYAVRSEAYVAVGLLVERVLGRLRLFVNGENLTNVRQTRWQPIVLPVRAPDGRWTTDAWAPLEGRNVNGGVRVSF